jgi:putative heme-binding domain-containing protein
VARTSLAVLRQKVQNHELTGPALEGLKEKTRSSVLSVFDGALQDSLHVDAALLLATWKDPDGLAAVRKILGSTKQSPERRLQALESLVAVGDESLLEPAESILAGARRDSLPLRAAIVSALGRLDHPRVAEVILSKFAKLEPELQPRAVEVLTQRSVWAKALLQAIQKQKVPATALNVNQVRKLLLSPDKELVALVKQRWGLIRTERNPAREKVIAEVRNTLRNQKGDPHKGVAVFQKVCSQCHKIHGQGQEVGPDITSNGRESVEQILVNVLDPNQVIGTGYQARNLVTKDGRVLIGLAVEENDQRVVLKIAGGKLETIPRKEIDEISVNPVSLMPEELEKQLSQEELANLFAFLSLDKPPTDPNAKRLPEERLVKPRRTTDPKASGAILAEVAPGFIALNIGEGGVELLSKYRNRNVVVKTHPVSQKVPCILQSRVFVPKDKKAVLILDVGHDTRGDWQLVVLANGKKLFESLVDGKTAKEGWARFEVDLSTLAGQEVDLELHNAANDWSYEFAYWGNVAVVTGTEKGQAEGNR